MFNSETMLAVQYHGGHMSSMIVTFGNYLFYEVVWVVLGAFWYLAGVCLVLLVDADAQQSASSCHEALLANASWIKRRSWWNSLQLTAG